MPNRLPRLDGPARTAPADDAVAAVAGLWTPSAAGDRPAPAGHPDGAGAGAKARPADDAGTITVMAVVIAVAAMRPYPAF